MVCTRTQPQCTACPLQKSCQAHLQGCEHNYPTRKLATRSRPQKSTIMLLLENTRKELMLEKRPPVGIWGGLWGFPECSAETDITQWCFKQFGYYVLNQFEQPIIYHEFSHFRLEIKPIIVKVSHQSTNVMESSDRIWYKSTNALPGGIPTPVAKLLERFSSQKEAI